MAIPKPIHIFLNISFLILASFFLLYNHQRPSSPHLSNSFKISKGDCKDFDLLDDYSAKCAYLQNNRCSCSKQGYIDYLNLFYCVFGAHPFWGYLVLSIWLVILFYLLGNTASVYFCVSLESLSALLNLPPTVAGVTLLSLGNGAPDAFSTIASFSNSNEGDLGLSSVLGGAFFVTSGVVGLISLCNGAQSIVIDKLSFIREIWYYMLVLGFLLAILIVGEVSLLASILFASLYMVYVVIVAFSYIWRKSFCGELNLPLLDSIEIDQPICLPKLENVVHDCKKKSIWYEKLFYLLELPLSLPRKLTIPDISEERWSKPLAIASVMLSPSLLATLWITKREISNSEESLSIYLFGGLVGLVLGLFALEKTESEKPPNKFLLPWLGAEFLMSVVWFYITAGELVSLLVSVGHILRISPSILAVTILAWGNSLGDLIANVAMAIKGGDDGVQIAISGCYAVPIFNTLVGLGISLVLSSWNSYPNAYVIPHDSTLYVTLGFMVCGLVWALVILPKRGMKLDRVFGVGLLALYLGFLCLRICASVGIVQIDGLFR